MHHTHILQKKKKRGHASCSSEIKIKNPKNLFRLDRHENILQDRSSHVLGHGIARLTTKTFLKIHGFQIRHKKRVQNTVHHYRHTCKSNP